ncbi:MAG: hypothetical protein V2A61_08250, partial [Calditrichota bacterium]
GIKPDASSPNDPEEMDGKGGLNRNMIPGRHYIQVDDAPAFAVKFDLVQASSKCPSLKRFIVEIERLIDRMNAD